MPFILNNQVFIDRVYLSADALIALPFLADVAKKALDMAAQRTLFASTGIPGDAIYVVIHCCPVKTGIDSVGCIASHRSFCSRCRETLAGWASSQKGCGKKSVAKCAAKRPDVGVF